MLKIRYFSTFFIFLLLQISICFADNFDSKIRVIKSEINNNDLKSAIKFLKKIEVVNEYQQDRVNILFGDIYLKINQTKKAEEFYEKSFFTTNKYIESLSLIGLAEVNLIQGKLDKAIKLSKQAIELNPDAIKPKITFAIAKTRAGEGEEAIKILNELYNYRKDAEVVLAISDYYINFDDTEQAIKILEDYLKRRPNNIKILDQIASLYLINEKKDKALEAKVKVLKFHELNKDKKILQVKAWIISVEPTYFDKPLKVEKKKLKELIDIKKEIENYDNNKIKPNYDEFTFAPSYYGSGFIVGDGEFVITNYHVIESGKKIAVRNGTGQISEANVYDYSIDYDLAILKLKQPYPKKFAISTKDFADPLTGVEIISIGYPGIGITFEQPTITQGIVSKVFDDQVGILLTTAAINEGNSGGPIFNLNGKLVGVSFATIDKLKVLMTTGQIPTGMGFAIKSNLIKEVFPYEKKTSIQNRKFSKSAIYEKMLPSIVFVAVSK